MSGDVTCDSDMATLVPTMEPRDGAGCNWTYDRGLERESILNEETFSPKIDMFHPV